MDFGQDITMQQGVGETVKRGEFLIRQICGISAPISLWLIALAGPDQSDLLEIEVFEVRSLAPVSVPLNAWFTNLRGARFQSAFGRDARGLASAAAKR